jgi:viroplasmin and RNaseH domain-containing protein
MKGRGWMINRFKSWFFKPNQHFQIRYNTKNEGGPLKWRIIADGEEHLASHIEIQGYMYGESSVVNGDQKMNIACDGKIYWNGTRAKIETGPGPELLP